MTDVKISGQTVYNTALFPACTKDDLLKFNPNKATAFDEGMVKCDQTLPQSRVGSWDLTTNETKLKVTDPNGDTVEDTIGTLNSTTLIVHTRMALAPASPPN